VAGRSLKMIVREQGALEPRWRRMVVQICARRASRTGGVIHREA